MQVPKRKYSQWSLVKLRTTFDCISSRLAEEYALAVQAGSLADSLVRRAMS